MIAYRSKGLSRAIGHWILKRRGFQEFLWLFVGPICTLLCLIGWPKFVFEVVQAELGLDNVDCVCQNLPVSSAMNNTYDVAFARAVSDPSTVWGISEQLLKSKGRLIFFLSTQPDNSAGKRELQKMNLEGISWQIEDIRIPKLNSPHKILVMDKQ